MPTKQLPPNPNLGHLKDQAKDLLKMRAARDLQTAQRIREFHPRFLRATDDEIFHAHLSLTDAQLAIAREYGFASWVRLKRHIEKPARPDDLSLPLQERIEDSTFRQALDLLDAGNEAGLRNYLSEHPHVVKQRVTFEGVNYFRNPTLLEFIAENPIRHGTLPANIVDIAIVILEAGAKHDAAAVNESLGLVCSGRIPRESGKQVALIDLLCNYGADPRGAIQTALVHQEFEAAKALIRRGAPVDLVVAAGLGLGEEAGRLLPAADREDRHRALALASQCGHAEIVRMLLDAGEDPDRYNPLGFHSHSTPLHQAALAGHEEVVRLLVERGARLDIQDTLWQGTPAGWALHGNKKNIAEWLMSNACKMGTV